MSDEFDREEEKRKLREKYAEEQKDREVTSRMSELLLQGATMTNKHCDACGSPIFRYQGEAFCPTCQAEGREGAQKSMETPDRDADQSTTEPTATADDAVEPTTARTPERNASTGTAERTDADTETRDPSERVEHASGTLDLDDARAALVDTITTLAHRAKNADDPRQARDLLAAANEAADTLDTLR